MVSEFGVKCRILHFSRYDDGAVAEDALHLSELVDAVRDRSREVWCALINFFKGTSESTAIWP